MPRLFAGFLQNDLNDFGEGGPLCPSTFALIRDSLSSLRDTVFPAACPAVPFMVKWGFFFILVALGGFLVTPPLALFRQHKVKAAGADIPIP